MYKEYMDGQTILFKGNTFCKAYDLSYLNKNYNLINKNLQNVTDIYYKCNESRNSWINYKNALLKPENKSLSYSERIILGLKNDKLSSSLEEIPETEYIDRSGFKYRIGPRDGIDSSSAVRTLFNVLSSNIDKRLVEADPDIEGDCNKIIVNFRTDITNAIITFNGLFENYEYFNNSNTTVIFKEDMRTEEELGLGERFDLKFPRDDDGEIRLDWCNILPYSWQDIRKIDEFGAVKRNEEWIIFEKPLNSDCILFYNKIMYFFEINPHDARYVRIIDSDIGNVNNFNIEWFKVVRFADENHENLKQQRLVGFFSESERTVYFPSTINNSIITYNGNVHEYIIKPDRKSIKFKIPVDVNIDIDTGIDNGARIYATNWYTGTLDGKSFYSMPNAELSKVANNILNTYKAKLELSNERIQELENILADKDGKEIKFCNYTEILKPINDIENPQYQVFNIKFRPAAGSINFFINGVLYTKDVHYSYYPEQKKIIWTFGINHNSNGFDITSNMEVKVVYDIYYKDNADVIKDIEAFKFANS